MLQKSPQLHMLERLQKIISRAGIASRRHAEQLITSGQVRVNGRVVTELGEKADASSDRIEAGGKLVQIAEERRYFLLHKPPRVMSTLSDPEGRQSLEPVVRNLGLRVYPVGRLDYDASGLMLLTDDGDLANRMLKLAPRLPQTYWFKVKGRLGTEEMNKLSARLRGRVSALRPTKAAREAKKTENPWYEIVFSDVSRDVLRRMMFESGHPVEKLRRVGLGKLELRELGEGEIRPLKGDELARLKQSLTRLESTGGSAQKARAARPE